MTLRNLIPMLNVSDFERSIAFYRDALHFDVVSDPEVSQQWRWAVIRSGEVELMLSESETGPPAQAVADPHHDTRWPVIFYFYPDDVVALHRHVVAAGYRPTEVSVTHYGMREFSLVDPDGHVLSFGEDADAPPGG